MDGEKELGGETEIMLAYMSMCILCTYILVLSLHLECLLILL